MGKVTSDDYDFAFNTPGVDGELMVCSRADFFQISDVLVS